MEKGTCCAVCPLRAELIECRAKLQAIEKSLENGQLVRGLPGDFRDLSLAVAARRKEG